MKRLVFAVAYRIDGWGHRLNLPRRLQEPLCFLMDLSCGMGLDNLVAEWRGRRGR